MRTIDTSILFDIVSRNTDHGIAVIDENGYFVFYNDVMGEIEGLKAQNLIGRQFFNVYPSLDMDKSSIMHCLRTKKPIYNDLQCYINQKGKKILVSITDLPIVDNGEIVGVIEMAQDIGQITRLSDSIAKWLGKDEDIKANIAVKKEKNYSFSDFLTCNDELKNHLEKIKQMSKYDLNVFIYGETGTGKEILAQSIYAESGRRGKTFIAQNCAAIPENLLESIFFGTEKGSFTGAVSRPGLFEQANGGVLLLDELNSFPAYLQAKLLRVLQEGTIRRIGENHDRIIDVRVIATVNESPQKLVESGRLREDLFYRLSPIYVTIPPLRDRREDIIFLSNHFMEKLCSSRGGNTLCLSNEAKDFFLKYKWPGNVRELINVIEYAIATMDGKGKIKIHHLPRYIFEKQDIKSTVEDKIGQGTYNERLAAFEKKIIIEALNENKWNVSKTAQKLAIKRQTLQNKILKLGISFHADVKM